MAYTLRRLLLAGLLAVAVGCARAERGERGERAERSVQLVQTAKARGSFLLHQLAAAINSGGAALEQEHEQELLVEQTVDSSWLNAMPNEFQVPVIEEFPLQLQTWLTDDYGLTVQDLYQSWRGARAGQPEMLCNDWGECYELAQIVAACCPF